MLFHLYKLNKSGCQLQLQSALLGNTSDASWRRPDDDARSSPEGAVMWPGNPNKRQRKQKKKESRRKRRSAWWFVVTFLVQHEETLSLHADVELLLCWAATRSTTQSSGNFFKLQLLWNLSWGLTRWHSDVMYLKQKWKLNWFFLEFSQKCLIKYSTTGSEWLKLCLNSCCGILKLCFEGLCNVLMWIISWYFRFTPFEKFELSVWSVSLFTSTLYTVLLFSYPNVLLQLFQN